MRDVSSISLKAIMSGIYFVDLDGTIFKHGTNDLLPGAQKLLDSILSQGGEIIFTTYRGDENFSKHKVYSREGAMEGIRYLKIPYKTVIFDISSPRIVVNDDSCHAIQHTTNEGWSDKEIDDATGFTRRSS